MRLRFPRVALLALAVSPGVALATDGYFQHAYGVKAQGLGGAGIAFPQDALAAATNPAGTVLVDDRVDAGLTWFAPKRGAEITAPSPVAGRYDGNGKTNFFLPEFGYTHALSDRLGVGIAVYGNGGMNTVYDRGIPLFGSGKAGVDLEQLFVSPSIAWQVNDRHAIGAAVNFAYQRFEARGLQNFDPAFTTSPGHVTNRGKDSATGWGLRLGWTGQVTPTLSLGATWSSRIRTGRFERYEGLFAGHGGFDIPENYGVGLAYKATPALTIAADAERIRYGSVRSIGLPLANLPNGLGASNGPGFGWRDITAFKIGADYAWSDHLRLRAGYNHSGQPIPSDQTLFNILAPGVVQDHVSAGATWTLADGGELSVAYTQALKETVPGRGSIPPGFGGGEANLHLEEYILGFAYGRKF